MGPRGRATGAAKRAPRVSVFGASHLPADGPEYAAARRLGGLLAHAGYVVCTGGYDGAMAAVSQGAAEAGGRAVGVTLRGDPRPANRWLSEAIPARDLLARLRRLLASDAWLAVDGAVGTLNEVALGWALAQKMRGPRPPLVLIGPRWVRAIDALADILAIAPADLALLTLVDTPEEALAAVEAGRRVT
jgi:uncharacterized protein (TIGR00725 family)